MKRERRGVSRRRRERARALCVYSSGVSMEVVNTKTKRKRATQHDRLECL
jgi:hypothetical protein